MTFIKWQGSAADGNIITILQSTLICALLCRRLWTWRPIMYRAEAGWQRALQHSIGLHHNQVINYKHAVVSIAIALTKSESRPTAFCSMRLQIYLLQTPPPNATSVKQQAVRSEQQKMYK
eukprot:scaffold5578_cov157-Skeletonema_marinoi.AAC.4